MQATQGQFDQVAFVAVFTDRCDGAAGGHQQALWFQVVDIQVIAQAFQPLVACQCVRRAQGAEQLFQALPGLVVMLQVFGESCALGV